MTGYASGQGAAEGYRWSWELRSVNGRGLDLRLRAPDWIDGLEAALRAHLTKAVTRGNVTLSLRVQRETGETAVRLNTALVDQLLAAMQDVEARAKATGVTLTPPTSADIVGLRGVLDSGSESDDTSALKAALMAEFAPLVDDFNAMRASEGAALRHVLARQLHEVAELVGKASALLDTRQADIDAQFRRNMARILQDTENLDEGRVAQELAVLAVKTDITEEIDRLRAHVAAALELLETGGAVGRKLDFLMQEFNREANTLCSKAQMSALTELGLALKVVVDQMREQVQNVE
ncbi:YicC/YloC family endoribonuclease [Aliishimia ponticola]|nr:YicC/YloC family endoribonuclease [Aliishimia ponticola]